MNGHHLTSRAVLPEFKDVNESTCMPCMGRGVQPTSMRDTFTGRLTPTYATCPACRGTGKVTN